MRDINGKDKISRRKALQTTGSLTVGCGVFSTLGAGVGAAEDIETADVSTLSDDPELVDTVKVDIPNESPDDANITKTTDGKEISPEYVITKNPVSINTKSKK